MKPVNFGIIGFGHIGKRHADMILRLPEGQLLGICDIRPAAKLEVEAYHVPFFGTVDQMLEELPNLDVVCIASPNGLHAQHALHVLEHGKHVIIEKPMALTKYDCEQIIFKALQMSCHVFCVMQNRYSPPSQWLKYLIRSGHLGSIYSVQINCFWNRDYRYYQHGSWKGTQALDGGTLFTQFSHFVDIMYWLFGDIKNIHARFYDFNHQNLTEFEDTGIVTFDFVQGGTGCIHYSTSIWDTNFESSITLIAEKGTVKVGGQYMNEVLYCNIQNYEMPILPPANPANDYGSYKGSAANHHLIFENVVDTLRGRSTITTNALEGLKVVEIIERIYNHKSNEGLA
ncbi:MAG: Gfo/Idh/MocA family oxidoreductase [Bacteroidia bacterium]|nr:Gfo/Idh/MocA family oxidoreductase [Bacteroidia bacterium]